MKCNVPSILILFGIICLIRHETFFAPLVSSIDKDSFHSSRYEIINMPPDICSRSGHLDNIFSRNKTFPHQNIGKIARKTENMASSEDPAQEENLYNIDPDGDVVIDLIRPEDENWDTDEEYEEDGFDDYYPDGEYVAATGSMRGIERRELGIDQTQRQEVPLPRSYRPVERPKFDPKAYGWRSWFDNRHGEEGVGNEGGDNAADDGEPSGNPEDDPTQRQQQNLCASFRVSSKCLSLASGYFKGTFNFRHIPSNTRSEGQPEPITIPAPWGFKAFKILMQIAHLHFIKIPDQLGINTMVKLVIAADYLQMLPVLNPWLFRWVFELSLPGGPWESPEWSHKNDMQLLFVSMHLGYEGVFWDTFERLVKTRGDETQPFNMFELPIQPQPFDTIKVLTQPLIIGMSSHLVLYVYQLKLCYRSTCTVPRIRTKQPPRQPAKDNRHLRQRRRNTL